MNVVFDKNWFKKNQKPLLWFLNTPITKRISRWVMKIWSYDCPINEKITEIAPNSITFNERNLLSDWLVFRDGHKEVFNKNSAKHRKLRNKLKVEKHITLWKTTDFRTYDKHAVRLRTFFYPIWLTMHIWDLFADNFVPQFSFGFSTLTQNPGTTGTGNPDDGQVAYNSSQVSWATIIAAAGTQHVTSSNSSNTAFVVYIAAGTTNNTWSLLSRDIFCFDTSSLTSGATISAAIMSLYGAGNKADAHGITPNVDIYTATPGNTAGLANGDFQQIGSTSQTGSPITYASWNSAAYNDFTFNGTGQGNISKTGISSFGVRNANYDVASSVPSWANSAVSSFNCNLARLGSNEPKLVVTYTVVTAPTVTTQAPTSVAQTTCTGNGNITATGGANATERGVCYVVGAGTPTTSDSKVSESGSFGTGAFTEAVTGLSANTQYTFRAYAINSAGTSYGSTQTITTTAAAPTVTTQAPTLITEVSAVGNGNITVTGGENPNKRGICWVAGAGTPTTADNKVEESGSFGTGAFTEIITGLNRDDQYTFRAYAINSAGTSYGNTQAFYTEDLPRASLLGVGN